MYEVCYIGKQPNWATFKTKESADKFIAFAKAKGYEIYKWDENSYMGE